MKRTKLITQKKLFIEELERPALALGLPGQVTTLAVGEECVKAK